MRPRKKNRDLPKRVYLRSGSYWYVHPSGKWEKLGRAKPEMYSALARIHGDQSGTMSSILNRYAAEVLPSKAESTRKVQAQQLEKLRAVYGHMMPEHIRKSDIAAFLDKYPASTNANRHIALLSHVFTKAIRWGLVEDNPCRGVQRNKERPRSRYVTDDEFRNVRSQMPPHIQRLMDLAYTTGQRQGDLLDLEWDAVRQDGIWFEQAKTGKRLVILHTPLQIAAVTALWRARTGAKVFSNSRGAALTPSAVQSLWQRRKPGFTFHDIRAKSASDHETGEHLGHDVQATLNRVYRRAHKMVRGL